MKIIDDSVHYSVEWIMPGTAAAAWNCWNQQGLTRSMFLASVLYVETKLRHRGAKVRIREV